jgi:hypothetical protein
VLSAAEALGVPDRSAVASIKLIALTGLRPGEAVALRWSDLRAGGVLQVADGLGGRVCIMGEAARRLVEDLPRTSDWLFPRPKGGARSAGGLDDIWRRLRPAAGLDGVRLLDLRHSFAARAAGLGVEAPALGRLVGLRQADSVARYPGVGGRALREAADRISGEIAALLDAPAAPVPSAPLAPAGEPLLAAAASGRWISVREAVARSGLSADTLWEYRRLCVGPPYRRVGARILYPEAAFEIWLVGRPPRVRSPRPS